MTTSLSGSAFDVLLGESGVACRGHGEVNFRLGAKARKTCDVRGRLVYELVDARDAVAQVQADTGRLEADRWSGK